MAHNSVSKFKVRVLPSLLVYHEKYNQLPMHLTFAFACLIRFYKGDWKGKLLPVQDDEKITDFFKKSWEKNSYMEISEQVLGNRELWDRDLTKVGDLKEQIAFALEQIELKGVEEGFSVFAEKLRVQ